MKPHMTEPREPVKIRDFSAKSEPVIPVDKIMPEVELNGLAKLEFDIETASGPVHAQLDFHYGSGWVEETFEHIIALRLSFDGKEIANYNAVMKTEHHPLVFDLRHREVQRNFRGKGLGTLGLQVMHEAVQNYVTKYLPGRCQGIIMDVGQPSLTRLIIDQDWLEEQGLSDYKHSDGVNLRYRPSSGKDAKIIIQQLQDTSERSSYSYAETSADYLVDPDSGDQIRAKLIRPLR